MTTEPRARFRDLVAAEWVKLRSLRTTWIAYAATALAVVGLNAGVAYDTYSHWTQQDAAGRREFVRDGIPLLTAFNTNAGMLTILVLGAVGASMITGEYGTGTVRTTFAAVPARRSVLAAKAVVLAAVTTVFGMLVAGASFALTQAILDGRGVGVPIDHPGAARVVLAAALLMPVCALTGMAVGAVVRQTVPTMIAVVVVLVLVPLMLTDGRYWSAVIGHATPFRSWLRLSATDPAQTPYPWTTGGAWIVYAVWALAAATVAVASVHRRDQ